MNNKVVYIHRRKDNNKVFYVGMGTHIRPFRKASRTKHWKNIVNKAGYEIEILIENVSKQDAISLEEGLIEYYGIENLCNRINKGTCPTPSKESRIKMSEAGKRKIFTDEHRKNISKANRGIGFGRKLSEETKAKMGKASRERLVKDETRLKMKVLQSGGNNSMAKKVIDINTNLEYSCITEACLALNLNKFSITGQLNGHKRIQNYNTLRYKI